MSVNNPEADIIAQIEKLEVEDGELKQLLAQLQKAPDRQVVQRQIEEIRQQIDALRKRLP